MAIKLTGGDLRRTTALPLDTSFTACGWCVQTASTAAVSSIFSIESSTGGGGNGIYWATAADGVSLGIAYSGHGGFIGAIPLVLNQPFFWAVTSSGSAAGTLKTYFRRGHDKTFALNPSSDTRTTFTPACFMLQSDANGRPFSGISAHFMVWDRVLTHSELMQQSYSHIPVSRDKLHLWAPLKNTQTYRADWSINGKLLTQNGGTMSPARAPMQLPSEMPISKVPLFDPSGGGGGSTLLIKSMQY